MALALISLVCILLFLTGTPILLVIAAWVAGASYFVADLPLASMGVASIDSIKSFVFLAVPLFIATGDFLTEGGISRRLVQFGRSLTSPFPARTANASILASGFFAAVSGSNSATAATIGRILGPDLTHAGFTPGRAAAIVAAGGVVGVIIPPSVIFVVYSLTVNVSAIDLFSGGIIPGVALVLAMMLTVSLTGARTEPGVGWKGFSVREVRSTAAGAWLGFVAIGLILYGVYGGLFSPTEAAGVVTLFCMFAGLLVTRQISVRAIPQILMRSASVTGLIVPLVAFSVMFQQVLGALGASEAMQTFLLGIGADHGSWLVVVMMLLLILIVGAMTESVAVVLILAPILAPVATQIGFDPVHWGVIFVVGTSIGFITPPYGLNLFVVSAVLKVPYGTVMRNIWFMVVPLLLTWVLVVQLPWMSLALLPTK